MNVIKSLFGFNGSWKCTDISIHTGTIHTHHSGLDGSETPVYRWLLLWIESCLIAATMNIGPSNPAE